MKILVEMSYLRDEEYTKLTSRFSQIEFSKDINDHDIEGLLSMPGFLKKENLDVYSNLKFVMVLTAGYDTLDLDYFKNRNIQLYNTKDVFSIQIAEDVFSKILYFNRNMYEYQQHMEEGIWKHHPVHYEIAESTVGILGTGSIGLEIAKRMKAFDAKVVGYKKTYADLPYFDELFYGHEGFEKVLEISDYIILALPLDQDTFHLINEKAFSKMKKSALLINIARGNVVDQVALIKALKTNQIRGACLDVTTPEPLPSDHELWKLKQVYITPHQAGSSPHVRKRLLIAIYKTVENYLKCNIVENRVI